MPAFTRVASAKVPPTPSGTRASAYNAGLLCSTGVASLDEVLGGGLPVGSLLLLEQDEQSSYADLLLRLFAAQGLSCKAHQIAILASPLEDAGGPEGFLAKLPASDDVPDSKGKARDSDDETVGAKDPMKIAFRYEGMKQTASPPTSAAPEKDVYCSMFDMTRPRTPCEADRKRTHSLDMSPSSCLKECTSSLEHIIETQGFRQGAPVKQAQGILRICIQSFAAPFWPASKSEDLVRFLLSLRHLLRNSFACAVMTIPSVLLRTAQGGPALVRRIEHYADAVVELQSFVSRPDLAALFPRYAGLINIRSLPALNTLVPPSARLSVLKGASGKQDLAFRLKRRRFVVETLHLDVEGGVNERKTPKEEESKMKASDVLGPKKPTFKADKPELYDF